LTATKAKVIVTHPVCLKIAKEAAKAAGMPSSAIVLIDSRGPKGYTTIDELVRFGSTERDSYEEIRLKPGEARTKLAFLCFSSGTTGKDL
jgi:4-coumarate--CoA ligase